MSSAGLSNHDIDGEYYFEPHQPSDFLESFMGTWEVPDTLPSSKDEEQVFKNTTKARASRLVALQPLQRLFDPIPQPVRISLYSQSGGWLFLAGLVPTETGLWRGPTFWRPKWW